MGKWRAIRCGEVLFLIIIGLLAGCGVQGETQTVGPPTSTVKQVTEWPEGFPPAGGGLRFVDMPAEAEKHFEGAESSREAEGRQDYYQTLQR